MRTACVLKINREGQFTVNDRSKHPSQCGSVGKRDYKYFVTIEATNKHLNQVGYVMENMLVDEYFQQTYHNKAMKCDPCEAMASRAIAALKALVYRENPKVELKRIYVRIHGTPASFIEAEWKNE